MADFIDDGLDVLPGDEEQGMFEHFRFVVDKGQEPVRVDKYMSSHMEDTSRHRIQCAIKEEYIVFVGEKRIDVHFLDFGGETEQRR